MSDNKSADWNWNDYFDHVVDPPMRETVNVALKTLEAGQGRQAVDLGCGSGNDTVHMIDAGFKVLAIDGSADGLMRLLNRPHMQDFANIETLQATFDMAKWPQNIWTNAGFSLPFAAPDVFEKTWQSIFNNLENNGVFSGQLFGLQDSWNGKVVDMNFHDENGVRALCRPYKILHFEEEKKEGQDAVGRSKFWHIFHVVLQK